MNREFTVGKGYRIFYIILALLMICAAGLLMEQNATSPGVWIVAVMLIFFGAFLFGSTTKRRITIANGQFTYVSMFKTTEIMVDQIKGVRSTDKSINIETNEGKTISLGSCNDYGDSQELKDWLTVNFTDLDAKEEQTQLTAIMSDTSLGYTEEDRKAKLNRAKYIATGYIIGGCLLAAGVLFANGPAITIASVIYPVLGALIIATSNGLIKLTSKKGSPFANIFIGVYLPALVLFALGLSEGEVLNFNNFWLISVGVVVVLTAMFYFADHTRRDPNFWTGIVATLLFGCLYSAGIVQQVNMQLDRSPIMQYQTTVADEYITHGKSTHYHLTLNSWGPQTGQHTVSVNSSMYNATPVGAAVVIRLRKGFLNIPWYTVSDN